MISKSQIKKDFSFLFNHGPQNILIVIFLYLKNCIFPRLKKYFTLRLKSPEKEKKNLKLSLPKVLTLDGFPKALGNFLQNTDVVVVVLNNICSLPRPERCSGLNTEFLGLFPSHRPFLSGDSTHHSRRPRSLAPVHLGGLPSV